MPIGHGVIDNGVLTISEPSLAASTCERDDPVRPAEVEVGGHHGSERASQRFCLHIAVIETLDELGAVSPFGGRPQRSRRPLRREGVGAELKISTWVHVRRAVSRLYPAMRLTLAVSLRQEMNAKLLITK